MNNLPLRIAINRIGEPDLMEAAIAGKPVDTPEAAHDFWRAVIAAQPDHEPAKEHLAVILTNARLRPLGWNLVAVGSLCECTAHPREILRPALVASAYGLVLMHNHPSGDPSPSEADRALTRRIREATELLQIRFLDHVIAGTPAPDRPAWFSFREHGLV